MLAIMVFFCTLYLLATEYISLQKARGEILLFRKRDRRSTKTWEDEEARMVRQTDIKSSEKPFPYFLPSSESNLTRKSEETSHETGEATFLWDSLCYEVPVKKGSKKILDGIEGWIKPRTLTALIVRLSDRYLFFSKPTKRSQGKTGAGKTSLLNVLADRTGIGIISGYIGVDSQYQGRGFAQKIGYAQQQDLHLSTATIREALNFSALLRQPAKYSKAEKLSHVDTVIDLLDMNEFAESVIGVPGEGKTKHSYSF